jgi:hypothetical protein
VVHDVGVPQKDQSRDRQFFNCILIEKYFNYNLLLLLLLMVIIEEYIKNQTKINIKTFKIRYKMHLNILKVMNKLIIRKLNKIKCE